VKAKKKTNSIKRSEEMEKVQKQLILKAFSAGCVSGVDGATLTPNSAAVISLLGGPTHNEWMDG